MKQKTFLLITIFLVSILYVSAQEKLKIKISDFDIDEPGLKSAWNHLKMGDKYLHPHQDQLCPYHVTARLRLQ